MREKKKETVSFTLCTEDAEKIRKLSPYSSAFVSILVHEFLNTIPVEEIWTSIEGNKPLSHMERLIMLEKFVKKKVRFG